MPIAQTFSSTDRMVRELPSRTSLLDSWIPSDRRAKGPLSFKAYDQASLSCPTDMWSYQRLFIEQRRDDRNLFAGAATVEG